MINVAINKEWFDEIKIKLITVTLIFTSKKIGATENGLK